LACSSLFNLDSNTVGSLIIGTLGLKITLDAETLRR